MKKILLTSLLLAGMISAGLQASVISSPNYAEQIANASTEYKDFAERAKFERGTIRIVEPKELLEPRPSKILLARRAKMGASSPDYVRQAAVLESMHKGNAARNTMDIDVVTPRTITSPDTAAMMKQAENDYRNFVEQAKFKPGNLRNLEPYKQSPLLLTQSPLLLTAGTIKSPDFAKQMAADEQFYKNQAAKNALHEQQRLQAVAARNSLLNCGRFTLPGYTEPKCNVKNACILMNCRQAPLLLTAGQTQMPPKPSVLLLTAGQIQTPTKPSVGSFGALKSVVCKHKAVAAISILGLSGAAAWYGLKPAPKVEAPKVEAPKLTKFEQVKAFAQNVGETAKSYTWDIQVGGHDVGMYSTLAVAVAALGYGIYKLAPIVKNAIVGQIADTQPVKQVRTVRYSPKRTMRKPA